MSADEEIGNEIGKLLLVCLVVLIAFGACGVYVWHHVHFAW